MYNCAMRLLAIGVFLLLPLCAQDKEKAKQAIPDPTNLKVLKITSGAEIRQVMLNFNAGLGVRCVYCHVQGNFASDENPKKEIARHMIEMSQHINSGFPDGKMHVTCYTCHRGEEVPATAPAPKPAP
jgi:hypothetical protein